MWCFLGGPRGKTFLGQSWKRYNSPSQEPTATQAGVRKWQEKGTRRNNKLAMKQLAKDAVEKAQREKKAAVLAEMVQRSPVRTSSDTDSEGSFTSERAAMFAAMPRDQRLAVFTAMAPKARA
jgi:hypothetical protein